MALLGKISVQLDAVTKGFTAAMKRAEKPVRGFARAIGLNDKRLTAFNNAIGRGATGALRAFSTGVVRAGVKIVAFTATMAAMAGVAVSVTAAISKLVGTMGEIDKITKASDKLGVATETMVAFRLAASRTGVDVNQVGTIIQRFTRRLAEAAVGTGEAKGALEELGIDPAAFQQLSVENQIRGIADAMGQVQSRGDQVRLAFKLFDTEGVGFLNTLDMIRDSWSEIVDETERAGVAFSRVDAAKVEEAADALDKIKTLLNGFATQVTIELSPLLTALSEHFITMADEAGGMRSVALDAVESMIRAYAGLGDVLAGIEMALINIQSLMIGTIKTAIQLLKVSDYTPAGQIAKQARRAVGIPSAEDMGLTPESLQSVLDENQARHDELWDSFGTRGEKALDAISKIRAEADKRAKENAKDALDRLEKPSVPTPETAAEETADALDRLAKETNDSVKNLKEFKKELKPGQFGQVGKTGALAAVGGFSGGIVASGGGRGSRARSVARAQIRARRAPGGANAGMIGGFNTGGVNSTMFGRLNGGANEGFGPGTSIGLVQGGAGSAVSNASRSMTINGKSTVSDEQTHTLLERLITDIRFTIGGGSKAVAG
jgi:division protein CdvB (Snf7/Vps24/ESCRT-III family)